MKRWSKAEIESLLATAALGIEPAAMVGSGLVDDCRTERAISAKLVQYHRRRRPKANWSEADVKLLKAGKLEPLLERFTAQQIATKQRKLGLDT